MTICEKLSSYYDAKGFTPQQVEALHDELKWCSEADIKSAVGLMTRQEMKMPNMIVFQAYCRSAIEAGIKRRKAELIRRDGVCGWCQSSGMVIVRQNGSKNLYAEQTMRCGECEIANLTGILKRVPAWTRLGSRDLEPTILEKTWTSNPSMGRLDEINRMPSAERSELLKNEPWLARCLRFYGKNLPTKPLKKTKPAGDDDGWD